MLRKLDKILKAIFLLCRLSSNVYVDGLSKKDEKYYGSQLHHLGSHIDFLYLVVYILHTMPGELIGLDTIDCARYVVAQNPQIREIFFRGYNYVPNQLSGEEPRFPVSRNSLLGGFDPGVLLNYLGEGFNIALDSKAIFTGGEETNFLMVDLAPSKTPDNQIKIEERLRELIIPHFGGGFLLETNRSYHYFGFRVVDFDKWLDFLGRCLISSIVTKTPDDQPNIHEVIADYRYIGHSILRRSTGLRVTSAGSKVFKPRSIAIVE